MGHRYLRELKTYLHHEIWTWERPRLIADECCFHNKQKNDALSCERFAGIEDPKGPYVHLWGITANTEIIQQTINFLYFHLFNRSTVSVAPPTFFTSLPTEAEYWTASPQFASNRSGSRLLIICDLPGQMITGNVANNKGTEAWWVYPWHAFSSLSINECALPLSKTIAFGAILRQCTPVEVSERRFLVSWSVYGRGSVEPPGGN